MICDIDFQQAGETGEITVMLHFLLFYAVVSVLPSGFEAAVGDKRLSNALFFFGAYNKTSKTQLLSVSYAKSLLVFNLVCKLLDILLAAPIIEGTNVAFHMLGSTAGRRLHLLLVRDCRRFIKPLLNCTCEKRLRGHNWQLA